MTYKAAIQFMEQIQKKGSVLGLEPVQILLNKLGNPQNHISVIHVAGTNGKGSICTFLESMYFAEGKKVGRYISPTLQCYLERFQINGTYMEETQFARLLSKVIPVLEQLEEENIYPTAFEIETVIAFLYFLEQQVDLVILETGMGGRLDATNVVVHPLCTVFASIGMDHMQFLGDSVEAIAYEKAGIMRAGCPAVVYPNSSVVLKVLTQEFEKRNMSGKSNSVCENNTELCIVDLNEIEILEEYLTGSVFCYKGEKYRIGLAGRFQIYNAVTAIETKLLLDGKMIKESLEEVTWSGRFEKMSDEPLFIRDGAHNIDGVKALRQSVQMHFTNRRIIFIIGVLRDKEYRQMMELLVPMASQVLTVTPPCERGLPAEELAQCVASFCEDVTTCISVADAVNKAKESYVNYKRQGERAVIIAWGSLSYIGQIKG